MEWHWQVFLGSRDRYTLTYDNVRYALTDVDFEVDDYSLTRPFLFSLTTPAWRVAYQADYDTKGLVYRPREQDAIIVGSGPTAEQQPLEEWLNAHKPDLFLEGDRLIDDEGKLIAPRYTRRPYDPSLLTSLDWRDVDLSKESQKPQRRTDSIQYYMSAHLQATGSF